MNRRTMMRTEISLNGIWKFAPTHDQHPTNNQNTEAGIPLYAHPRLDRSDWENVSVPGVWQRYREVYRLYEGVCWFVREFEVDSTDGLTNAKLHFGGVNYRADVYLNGQYVGTHESGYTPFSFDVTGCLTAGRNTIAVQVDNRPLTVKWPNDWGYGVFGGIHRDVTLELCYGAYLSGVELTPDYDVNNDRALLHVRGTLNGETEDPVTVRLNGQRQTLTAEQGVFDETLTFDGILPWSPTTPILYELSVSVCGVTFRQESLGFRHPECHARQILLNGEQIHLNGACYVYDSPEFGLVMDERQLTADLRKMKDAHINAIRTHYPMDRRFYELCDRMGFLVWIEPNVYCSKPDNREANTVFARPDYVDNAVQMVREMICEARSHASVMIYGIGNECNVNHPEAFPFFQTLPQTIRDTDRTRPIGYASLYGDLGEIGALVDIMGVNAYYGWYGTFPTFETDEEKQNGVIRTPELTDLHAMLDRVKDALPADTPILMTEFGADSVPGYHSEKKALWSEEYHAALLTQTVTELMDRSDIAGQFVFAFTDYDDPSKPKNGHWNGLNLKGLLAYDRAEKAPYEAIREIYGKTNR